MPCSKSSKSSEMFAFIALVIICFTGVFACPSLCVCKDGYYVYCDNRSITTSHLEIIFKDVPKTATYIDLSSNVIDALPDGIFEKHTQLVNLNLANNRIRDLTADIFRPVNKLRKLYLEYNNLSRIKTGVFTNLTRLQYLNLEYNQIKVINGSSFHGTTNVVEINLKGNQLEEIPSKLFSGMSELRVLDLSHNSLFLVSDNTFENLVKLETLTLAHNQIGSLSTGMLNGLSSLKHLSLHSNKLYTLHKSHFDSIRDVIQNLQISSNHIITVDNDVFFEMQNLQILNLSNNQIEDIGNESFRYLSLDELLLPGNKLKRIRRNIFYRAKKIASLDLSRNEITYIDTGAFDSFRESIFVLNLEKNKLTNVRSGMIRRMQYLQVLRLAFNNISNINGPVFSDLKNVVELDVRENNIQVLTSEMITGLNSLKKFYLSCNPLNVFKNFKFTQEIHVTLNLSVLSITYDSVNVTWPYKEGSQLYWTVKVMCVDTVPCPLWSQPEFFPANEQNRIIGGLSPSTRYYICVNPIFINTKIVVEQCIMISTSTIDQHVSTTQKAPGVTFGSTSGSWTLRTTLVVMVTNVIMIEFLLFMAKTMFII